MTALTYVYWHRAADIPDRYRLDTHIAPYNSTWGTGEIAFVAYNTHITGTVPVYRHQALNVSSYFYYDTNKIGKPDWSDGEIAFYAYPAKVPGSVPVYQHTAPGTTERFYYDTNDFNNSGWSKGEVAFYACDISDLTFVYWHRATDSPDRYYYDTKNTEEPGWSKGEAAFAAYSTQISGTIPIYRHYATNASGYYYYDTHSTSKPGWNLENTAFFAYATPIPGTVPIYQHSAPGTPEKFYYDTNISNHSGWSTGVIAFYAYTINQTFSNNWMSAIQDGSPISEISIPGTHDSCARFEKNLIHTQCQWFSITQQLNRGIRFLDIRCKFKADDEKGCTQGIYFPIHHATTFQHIFFEEVQAQCIAFLTENPSEFILMNVQMEYEGDGNDFREKFLELTAPYQTVYWYMKDTIPAINECRGRIVLIRAYDPNQTEKNKKGWPSGINPNDPNSFHIWPDGEHGGGLEWNGFDNDGESHNIIFNTQNGWEKWSGNPEEKGNMVEKYIKNAEQNAVDGKITLNFASYAKSHGPGPNAQGMNTRLKNFLGNYRPGGKWGIALGTIPLDFIGNTGDSNEALENLIIEHQKRQALFTLYNGIAKWQLKISS